MRLPRVTRAPHRACVALAAAGVVVGGAAPAVAAPASTAPTATQLATSAQQLSDGVVGYWRRVQLPDGRFPDPVAGGGSDYGTAMLGLAMARRGLASGDAALLQAGLGGIRAELEHPVGGSFEPLVLAEAYRWGVANLPGTALGAEPWAALEPALRADLAGRGAPAPGTAAERCLKSPTCWINLKLVGALAGLQLLGTGITSQTPGTLLADASLGKRLLLDLGTRAPQHTDNRVTRTGESQIDGGGILSDPPRNPLAYHALSAAFLGRAVDALGAGAPPSTGRAATRTELALLALAAPDGDLSWFGRGQGQVWVRAIAAEAAARTARDSPVGSALRSRALALVARELEALRAQRTPDGAFELVPGAVLPQTLRARHIDSYATMRGYNGLAIDALDRIPGLLAGLAGTATTVPSARDGATRAPVQAGIAAITRGGTWIGFSGRARALQDARYGSGLLALQRRAPNGLWRANIPARPLSATPVSTLGLLVRGQVYAANGQLSPGDSSAVVQVAGGWGDPGGVNLDPGTTWRWAVGATGVASVSFRAKRDRQIIAQALAGDNGKAIAIPGGVTVLSPAGLGATYALRVAGRVPTVRRLLKNVDGSAYDTHMRVLKLIADVKAGDQVTLTITPRG